MKTNLSDYPTKIQNKVNEILSIDLEDRMRIVYLSLLETLKKVPKNRHEKLLKEYLVEGLLEDLSDNRDTK